MNMQALYNLLRPMNIKVKLAVANERFDILVDLLETITICISESVVSIKKRCSYQVLPWYFGCN